jgi:hypothetical protein
MSFKYIVILAYISILLGGYLYLKHLQDEIKKLEVEVISKPIEKANEVINENAELRIREVKDENVTIMHNGNNGSVEYDGLFK